MSDPTSGRRIARRLAGAGFIVLCYVTTFLLLVLLSDPVSPGQSWIGEPALFTIGALATTFLWGVTGWIIREFMMRPQTRTNKAGAAYLYSAGLLFAVPGISVFLAWRF